MKDGAYMLGATATNLVLDSDTLDRQSRLRDYVEHFREVFARADQYRWFTAYLRGVRECMGRRNVEAIARAVADDSLPATAVAQALNNFITHSPWDHRRLQRCYRDVLRKRTPRQWVIHDGVFPKNGRCSVGVQRQFARALGRKINCQVAVVISAFAGEHYLPLSAQLYLPSYWLRQNDANSAATVPEPHRQARAKSDIAAALLTTLLDEGPPPVAVLAEENYASDSMLRDQLGARGVSLLPVSAVGNSPEDDQLRQTLAAFEGLKDAHGLDHFEGRSWQGWHHHVSIVMAAHGFSVWARKASRSDTLDGSAP
jgi:SRSO17 transposase